MPHVKVEWPLLFYIIKGFQDSPSSFLGIIKERAKKSTKNGKFQKNGRRILNIKKEQRGPALKTTNPLRS